MAYKPCHSETVIRTPQKPEFFPEAQAELILEPEKSMRNTSMIQYLGFEEDSRARTCIFRVVNTALPERQFELSVTILLLKEHEFKIQDLPDLCFSRLKKELSTETEQQVPPLKMNVSAKDLKDYIENHYAKKRNHTRGSAGRL